MLCAELLQMQERYKAELATIQQHEAALKQQQAECESRISTQQLTINRLEVSEGLVNGRT